MPNRTIFPVSSQSQGFEVSVDTANFDPVLMSIKVKTTCIKLYQYVLIIPVVPHKAVAEVSKVGRYRRGELL